MPESPAAPEGRSPGRGRRKGGRRCEKGKAELLCKPLVLRCKKAAKEAACALGEDLALVQEGRRGGGRNPKPLVVRRLQ